MGLSLVEAKRVVDGEVRAGLCVGRRARARRQGSDEPAGA